MPEGINGTEFYKADPSNAHGWEAKLELDFALRNNKTMLVQRRHYGPLTVQRPFYPEGTVCHVYVLHPPGGIVAGDSLSISIRAENYSHALITTPSAGKFYRSTGDQATQTVSIKVSEGAALEWLPQETIIYEGAHLKSKVKVELAENARFIGWEILSLGRPASGEKFNIGLADMSWQIYRLGQPLFLERLQLDAKAFSARWGLQGLSACGTLFVSPASTQSLLAIQELIGDKIGQGVTLIDNMLICRAIDNRSDLIRNYFEKIWEIVRPDCMQRKACSPRIWAT